jgi:excisionase family DNA binding protein
VATTSKQDLIERLPDAKLAYRIEEAAIATGISRAVLFRRIAEGRLTTRKDGKITLILRGELDRYLSQLPAGSSSAVRSQKELGEAVP